ncbi:hypothetical protein HF521_006409 [Silurus meridionalis]|uniref:ubiquitinyl hydrolase 1 n=1 Tax=Silurus meridionalis TaxID=175797 RepID=A0A8T0AX93_SILME|nr:hypothetical protein HF521_006409 [Silurus meridionalis]
MESGAGANTQQGEEKRVEQLMDEYLKANGLYRKKIAKDGSCLFRAVAEQVLHSQGLHTRVRTECVKYLRQKRDLYESFIEGDFEEYLQMLQDPQSWVGQVEISALSVLYKHDFIIYQIPGEPPVNITENSYPDKVLLCFLNDNHYDSVYPISSIKNAAVCQSILYELLYERVYGVERNVLAPSLRGSKTNNENIEAVERESSGDSDQDEGEDPWSSEATARTAGVSNRTSYKGRGRGQTRGVGRGRLPRAVQDSLNPSCLRNVQYNVWLRSKRVQQRRDFCMAAGMHYKAGDKCQVRLNNTDRFYSAYIQDVSPDDGPVTVFIEELGQKYNVPLWNLRTPSEDAWSTVTEKNKRHTASSSSNGPTEHDTKPGKKPMRSMSHGPSAASQGSAPGTRIQQQHSWPSHSTVEPQGKNGSSRRSDQGAGGLCASPVRENEDVLLELLNKDEENFPTLEASAQAASVEGSRRAEKKGSRKKVSTDTKEQFPNPIPKPEKEEQVKKGSVDQDQRTSPSSKEKQNPNKPPSNLPSPSASKSTKASLLSTTAPARVPYKPFSSLPACILPSQSQTAPVSSARSQNSVQTTPKLSPTAPAPSTRFVPDYPHAVFNCLCSIDKTPGFVPDYPHAVFKTPGFVPDYPHAVFKTPGFVPDYPHAIFKTPGSVPDYPMQSSKPQDSFQTTPMQSSKPQDSFQTTPMQSSTDRAPSTKPQDSFQTTPMQSSTDTASSTRPIVLLENTSSVSSQCSTTQCLTGPKPIPVTTVSSPRNSPRDTDSTFVVTTAVSLTPEAVTTLIASQTTTTTAPSDPVPTPLSHLLISQTASEPSHALSQSTSATPQDPVLTSKITFAAAVPCSTDAPAALKTPESAAVPAQPALSPGPPYPVGFGHLPYPPYPPYPAAMPSLSPNIPAPMPDPCLPPAVPTPPYSHATESYLYEHTVSPVAASAGGALVSDPPPESSITFEQLCQERLYPGFPQNEKGEPVQTPLFSDHKSGKDLPNDTSVLRFFFNLGVKAYMYQMLPPLTYLAPLVQAYQHTPLNISPSPGSWQPENNSRPIYSSPNPSPARPAHFDVRGVPSSMDVGVFGHPSLPMQMSLPVVSHPTVYAGMCSVPPAGPSLQYSAPQHHSVPPPGLYGMEMHRPTVPPIMEGGQGVHSSMTAQLEKAFWAGQNQHHLEGGDIKPGGVPVTVEMHSSGAQVAVGGQSKGVEPTLLANGNRQEISVGFIGPPLEGWKTEFGTDPKTVRSYQSPSYRSGGRHGQNDRGGYRGRGTRERRENTGWVRHDGQMLYHRGSGGRSRGRGYTNTRATGYPGGHCAPES